MRRGGRQNRLRPAIHAGIQADGHHRPGGVGLHDADAQRLRHVAGIVHFHDVRTAGLSDRQPVRLPTHVGRVGVGVELDQVAQRVRFGLEAVVPQRPLPQPRQPGLGQLQLRQLVEFLEPPRIGRIDFHHLRELAIGPRAGRPLRAKHQQLHPPLGDRPLPVQRLADRLRPVGIVHGHDGHVVNALLAGQGDFQRNLRLVAGLHVVLLRPQFLPAAAEKLDLDPCPAVFGQGQEVRIERTLEHLAGGEHQAVAGKANPERIARRAHQQQAIAAVVEFLVHELAGQIRKRRLDGRGPRGIVGRRELHAQLRRAGRGHQHVHAVVAARAALLDHQLLTAAGIAGKPHRAGLVGLDAQRLRLRERAVAYGDRALPQAVRAAAPGDPHAHVVGHRCMRRQRQQRGQRTMQRVPWPRLRGHVESRGEHAHGKRGHGTRACTG